ncbi:MAG: hypothetical protein ACKOBF_13280, partial [Limnohabitans sp.]
ADEWRRPGLQPLSASQRIQSERRRPDAQPVVSQAGWGAFTEGEHLRVVHAVVYASKVAPELAQGLFDGVQR